MGKRPPVQGDRDPPGIASQLARARVKISSGCFTACDVACDLDHIEALLILGAVKMHFNRLNFDGACACGVGERLEA